MNLYRQLVTSAVGSIADNLNDMAKSGQSQYCPNVTVEQLVPVVDDMLRILDEPFGDSECFSTLDSLMDGYSPKITMCIRDAIQNHLEAGHCDEDVIGEITLAAGKYDDQGYEYDFCCESCGRGHWATVGEGPTICKYCNGLLTNK
jgi:hypothetical protein